MTAILNFHRPREVAPRLGVSTNLLKTLVRDEEIPCVRLTGRQEIRFTDSQVHEIHQYLLDKGLVSAAAATAAADDDDASSEDTEPTIGACVPTALTAAAALLANVHSMRGSS